MAGTVIVDTKALGKVDWRRYQVGMMVRTANEEIQGIRLSLSELKILRRLVSLEIGGERPIDSPGIKALARFWASMEQFMVDRDME